MATEDLTTYTKEDADNKITLATDRCTWDAISRDVDTYAYKDKGAGHFDGDFVHWVDVHITSASAGGNNVAWGLANLLDDRKGIADASGDELNVLFDDDPLVMYLKEHVAGTAYSDTYSASEDTTYYLKIKRDESIGTHGRLYCYIYSNTTRTVLLDTLQLDLHEKEDFQYIYVAQNWNSGHSGSENEQSGWCENLDLAPPAGKRVYGFIIG